VAVPDAAVGFELAEVGERLGQIVDQVFDVGGALQLDVLRVHRGDGADAGQVRARDARAGDHEFRHRGAGFGGGGRGRGGGGGRGGLGERAARRKRRQGDASDHGGRHQAAAQSGFGQVVVLQTTPRAAPKSDAWAASVNGPGQKPPGWGSVSGAGATRSTAITAR